MRFCWFLLIIFLLGCNNAKVDKQHQQSDSTNNHYARGFRIIESKGNKTVQVLNPYQSAKNVIIEYYLSTNKENNAKAKDIIKIPVTRVICMSTSYVAFIDKLSEVNTIIALSGKFSSNDTIKKKFSRNEIFDIGYEQSINFEHIIQLKPDVIFAYGVREDASGYIGKLKELGIPVIMVGEFLEDHPLARAEWIKFFGAFFNKDSLASSIFDTIVYHYNELKTLASTANPKPKVMINIPWNGTWYIPGGKSFISRMITDAGGDYLWKNTKTNESIPMDIELAFTESMTSDIWINAGQVNSLKDITKIDSRLQNLKPFKIKTVFNNNARLNEYGGNDFWESGTVNPHIVLEDLIVILHPDILTRHKLYYYKKLD